MVRGRAGPSASGGTAASRVAGFLPAAVSVPSAAHGVSRDGGRGRRRAVALAGAAVLRD